MNSKKSKNSVFMQSWKKTGYPDLEPGNELRNEVRVSESGYKSLPMNETTISENRYEK